jgi:hypothetical protein
LIGRRVLLATAVTAAFFAACGGEADRELSKVFVAPPWTADETYSYRLTRVEDDEPYGDCVLQTRLNAEGSNTRLDFLCTDGKNRDDGTALVEPDSLMPISSNRTVVHPDDDERLSFSAFYEPPLVKYVSDEDGKTRETTRELPAPDETSPDPGYYDDVSLLWLVRGLDLSEGYEGSFENVSAGTGQTFRADISVERRETVTVPAGEFEVWRVRLRTAVDNLYWVEVDAPHRLIRARIPGVQDVNYELLSAD